LISLNTIGSTFLICAVWICCDANLAAAEPEWRAGFAQVKVTPERPVLMAGYGARKKPFDKVGSDLYVKAVVLEDGEGHRAALVTSDLLGFTAEVTEPICERIGKNMGLQREHILLNSSHTHTGPQLSLKTPASGDPQEGEALRTVEYTKWLQDRVVEVVAEAAKRLEPVQLAWGSGAAHFVMNRREFTPNGVVLGANPRGLADRSVPVLKITDTKGSPRSILFGTAVHNTTLRSDYQQICADYAGFAQTLLQEKCPGTEAMFLLGCAGDADPYPFGNIDLARQHGAALGTEVSRVAEGKLRPVRGPLRIAFARAELPLESGLTRDNLQKLAENKASPKNWGATEMLALLDKGEKLPMHYSCPVTVWQFGDDLTLVGLPGEVVVDYVPLLEKALGPNQLWIAAYCNDVFGYLPSARVLSEAGYETRGLNSGGAGFFTAESQEVMLRTVRDLARQAGQKMPE
jgi:neutral ceramidase